MLVLSRKDGESIRIGIPGGPQIDITVCRTSEHQCRLGIDAPREVEIWRSELLPPQSDSETTSAA